MLLKTGESLLQIENLQLHFRAERGVVRAVDNISLEIRYNEAMVILGESGCGKSSLAKAILRLLPRNVQVYDGSILLENIDLMELGDDEFRRRIRWSRMSLVPQAALNSLNPVLRVGDQVAEPLMIHHGIKKESALDEARKMFQNVGVPADFLYRYAFELSGGMRQRVAIAMALVTAPSLIILDEPTSALDVLTQANIMNVLKRIKNDLEVSYILITHDIATSSELADRVAVMYAGQIVEVSDAARFFSAPLHPYSQKLMASVPKLRSNQEPEFITGQPPSLLDIPSGCRFADRCPHRFAKCVVDPPVFKKDGRQVKCWLYE
jgi:peptide/nickel transport system ATP-binding protein